MNTSSSSSKFCKSNFSKQNVLIFFDKPTTQVSEPYLTHWNGLDNDEIRSVDIKLAAFLGSERITCIAKDAYDLFATAPGATILSCNTVFSNWQDNEDEVTFWMKDQSLD